MPSNNPYENDPFGQMSAGEMVREVALAPYRPSTWISLYGANPGMWSIGKGIYVPFVGRHLETGGRFIPATMKHIARSYQGRGVISGTVTAARRTIGALHKGGYVGGRFFKQGAMATEGFGQLQAGLKNRFLTDPNLRTKIGHRVGIVGREFDDFVESTARRVVSAAQAGKKTAALTIPGIKGTLGSVSVKGSMRTVSKGGAAALLKGGLSKAAIRTPLKLALGAGKAVSIVGAAMFAWDIIKMVGEPLGAAAMQGAYNYAEQLNNRFMPEMGGNLSVAYLSRGAATERQRAIQAMSRASMTGRSAFGQEAMLMHR